MFIWSNIANYPLVIPVTPSYLEHWICFHASLAENILHCLHFLFFQFVADGVFKAELNNFLTRELAEDGYSGVEVRVTPTRTEIIILATRTQNVLGEKGRRIRELTSVVQKRFNFPEGTVEVCIMVTIENLKVATPEKLPYSLGLKESFFSY